MQNQKILGVCALIQQEIKLIARAVKLNLPVKVTHDSVNHICNLTIELKSILTNNIPR